MGNLGGKFPIFVKHYVDFATLESFLWEMWTGSHPLFVRSVGKTGKESVMKKKEKKKKKHPHRQEWFGSLNQTDRP